MQDPSRCQHLLDEARVRLGEGTLASDAPLNLHAHNVTVRPSSTDLGVVLQVRCSPDFSFLERLLEYMPQAGPVTFLDAGANMGLASILFADFIRFNGEVLAVEANPDSHQLVVNNTRHAAATVTPVHAAIVSAAAARNSSSVDFAGKPSSYNGFRLAVDLFRKPRKSAVSYSVPAQSLAQLKVWNVLNPVSFRSAQVSLCALSACATRLTQWRS